MELWGSGVLLEGVNYYGKALSIHCLCPLSVHSPVLAFEDVRSLVAVLAAMPAICCQAYLP